MSPNSRPESWMLTYILAQSVPLYIEAFRLYTLIAVTIELAVSM